MDDVTAHFFVTVGDVCASARLGHMPITLHLDDGTAVTGVPAAALATADDPDALDHTGYARELDVAGTTVLLDDVLKLVLQRP